MPPCSSYSEWVLVLVLVLSGSKAPSAVFVRPAGLDMRVRIRRGRSYVGSSGRGGCCEAGMQLWGRGRVHQQTQARGGAGKERMSLR